MSTASVAECLTLRPLVTSDQHLPIVFEPRRSGAVVGRGAEEEDVTINDDSVSREHARVLREEGEWLIENLDPVNGTFVNLIPMGPRERSYLPHGAMLELGAAAFVIEIGDAESLEFTPFLAPRAASSDPDAPARSTMRLSDWTRLPVIVGTADDSTAIRERAEDVLSQRLLMIATRYSSALKRRFSGVDAAMLEDAAQTAVWNIVRRLRRDGPGWYDPQLGRLRSLLRKSLANALSDEVSRKRPTPVDPQDPTGPWMHREAERVLSELDARDVLGRLHRQCTNATHWEVFALRTLKGLSAKETSTATGVSVTNVHKIVSDQRKRAIELYDDAVFS